MRPFERLLGELELRDLKVRYLGQARAQAQCPSHSDRTPSLSVTEQADGKILLLCHAGCETEDVLAAIGLEWRDLFADNGNGHRDEEAVYRYLDEQGKPLFEVVRFTGKQFRQRLPDGSWGLNGARRVLYRLPRVLEAVARGENVMVVEGEKDVHTLEKLGIAATCNPGGAGKWKSSYNDFFVGAKVVVVADRDEPGYAHARQVAEALRGVAAEVDVVEPTKGKDVSDHLAAGGTIADLVEVDGFGAFGSIPRGDQNHPNPVEPSFGSTEPNPPFAAPMSEKLAGVPPEPNWLWEGYLSPGALTLLAGRPKVGKTTLLFPLIAALEQGRPFLDRPTFATRVLMLSEEREQTLAEKRQLYLNGADPWLLMRHEQGGRSWPELVEQARVCCAEHEIGVLVVDTWDKWTGLRGDDESKAGAVIEALEPLMLAAGDGLAVLIVAHQRKAAGKHGEAVRGSNAITGGVDVIVELERAPEELGRRMRVLRAESRFTATPEELVGELTEERGYIAQGDLDAVKREAEGEKMAELVESAPGSTTEELAEAADIAPATMKHKLKVALEDGYVARRGAGRKGDAYRWYPRGHEEANR
jgi:5S rRNA maturation endonuclease (ribonuclease M5)